jgi:DNA adenine methylase
VGNLKTPISYYGGKQNLVEMILPMMPKHIQYVEPFCGGATLFWKKRKSEHEAINDYDLRVSNFWFVLKTDFERLQFLIQNTLHSEHEHQKAKEILSNPIEDKVLFAWAFWVQTTMSFSNKIFAGFAFSNERAQSKTTRAKRETFNLHLYDRIKDAEIFNRDAIELIKAKDSENTFMYLDPPYAESNCGHYEDKKEVYYRLLDLLPTLKSKWLMSSYPSEQLTKLREDNNWNFKDIQQSLGVSGKHNTGKMKTECLTWNYEYEGQTIELF